MTKWYVIASGRTGLGFHEPNAHLAGETVKTREAASVFITKAAAEKVRQRCWNRNGSATVPESVAWGIEKALRGNLGEQA